MVCVLCGQRRARRACPALGQQICAVCCGTKRLVEIRCPNDCPYLTTAREHPPAVLVRQRQRDLGLIAHTVRDLSERQSQLFLLINSFLASYRPPDLHSLVDGDIAAAVAALAATYETASRGLIYEHRPASIPAERLAAALKPIIAEAGQHGGSAFERDAAVVLRRVEDLARRIERAEPPNGRAFLDLVGRVMRRLEDQERPTPAEAPRLIVP